MVKLLAILLIEGHSSYRDKLFEGFADFRTELRLELALEPKKLCLKMYMHYNIRVFIVHG